MAITGKTLTWKDCSPVQFVRRWETLAEGPSARLYERHPGTQTLTGSQLKSLYALWKDRSKLSAADLDEVSLLTRGLASINAFRQAGLPREAEVLNFYEWLTRMAGRRFMLKLFALHAALPRVFPPLSPPRLAAFYRLTEAKAPQDRRFTERLLPTYFTYQKFFFDFSVAAAAYPSRVDRALLAFGQYIARYDGVTSE